jgi:hypothetical protein
LLFHPEDGGSTFSKTLRSTSTGIYDVTSQKIVLIIVTAVRTLNPFEIRTISVSAYVSVKCGDRGGSSSFERHEFCNVWIKLRLYLPRTVATRITYTEARVKVPWIYSVHISFQL